MKRVYTYGAFDLLHPGHIHLLERARALGDYLIVGIVPDDAIRDLKGKDRPIQTLEDRVFIVDHLDVVDEIMIQESYDPTNNLKKLKENNQAVDILVKGDDWDYIPGTETIGDLGGILVKLPYSQGFSTSDMIKKIRGQE